MAGKLPWVAGLLFLFLTNGAAAAVDAWVFALSWQPGYCSRHRETAECQADHHAGLVLHGLWPDSAEGPSEFCAATSALREIDAAKAWCQLPALNLPEPLSATLDAVMPGRAVCLDRHEWARHGSCAAMKADEYFSVAAGLVNRVNTSEVGKLLRQRAGAEVSISELNRAAARDTGLQGAKGFSFICSRQGQTYHLAEVWIGLTERGPWLFPKPAAIQPVQPSPTRLCPDGPNIIVDGEPDTRKLN